MHSTSPIWRFVLCAILYAVSGTAASTEDAQCAVTSQKAAKPIYDDFNRRMAFDTATGEWHFNGDDGPIPIRSDKAAKTLADAVRGKRLLYMGDSTARNPAITLVALLCNRVLYPNCRQIASANANDGNATAWMCRHSMEGDVSSVFGRKPHNVCEAMVRSFVVPLINMTLPEMPTLAARKRLWPTGKLPPMNRIVVPSYVATM